MLEILISIIQMISLSYVIIQIKGRKIKITIKNMMMILIMILCGYLVAKVNLGFSKTIIMYSVYTICYKEIYNISFKESSILNFISVIMHCASEIILGIITIILNINTAVLKEYLEMTPLSGLLIFFIIIIMMCFIKKRLKSLNKVLQKENVSNIFYIVLIILTAILYSININKITWKNSTFIINNITVFIFGIIIFLLFKEKYHSTRINNKFNKLFSNSQEVSTLLEKYQKINHENINDLIVIKSKIPENKKVQEYIDLILKEKNIKNESKWICEINKINDIGINGFLSLKLNEMIDNNIKVDIEISNQIRNYDFKTLTQKEQKDFCRILGVYLDNAYEASKESEEKEIIIEFNIIGNKLEIVIANTFDNKINLNKIGEYGYTTKGMGHGIGLSLTNDIINKNNIFTQKRQVIKNYYYQFLYIRKK